MDTEYRLTPKMKRLQTRLGKPLRDAMLDALGKTNCRVVEAAKLLQKEANQNNGSDDGHWIISENAFYGWMVRLDIRIGRKVVAGN